MRVAVSAWSPPPLATVSSVILPSSRNKVNAHLNASVERATSESSFALKSTRAAGVLESGLYKGKLQDKGMRARVTQLLSVHL
jgi:hypothetical protein